jgi:hypothetical protein
MILMVPIPKLAWLARLTPDKEPVVLSGLIRFVDVTEFRTRVVAPSGAAVNCSVELKTRVPVLKLRFGALTNPLEP